MFLFSICQDILNLIHTRVIIKIDFSQNLPENFHLDIHQNLKMNLKAPDSSRAPNDF